MIEEMSFKVISGEQVRWVCDDNFPYFSLKTYVVGTHKNRLGEAILMSTHNICFKGLWWFL